MKIFIFSKPEVRHVDLEAKLQQAQIDFHHFFLFENLMDIKNHHSLDKLIVDLDAISNTDQVDALMNKFVSLDILLLQKTDLDSNINLEGLTESEVISCLETDIENQQLREINRNKTFFLIKISNKYKKVIKSEIDYISSEGKYSELHISDRKYSMRISLKALMELLPSYFIRVHASFIVNTNRIETINSVAQKIELDNQVTLAYSRKYKTELFSKFSII